MYENAKSCIFVNGVKTDYFPCNVGVRQGENLSPLLFSLYMNDLSNFISNSNMVSGVTCNIHELETEAIKFVKLFILLYADDTVLLAENANDLQNLLNIYSNYCEAWKLKLNTSKTKVLFFSRGRQRRRSFHFNDVSLDTVNEYKYLGILFNRSGSFFKTKQDIAKQATKAMFALIKKSKHLCLPVDIQIDLFNKMIKPILLYGCEIWGSET